MTELELSSVLSSMEIVTGQDNMVARGKEAVTTCGWLVAGSWYVALWFARNCSSSCSSAPAPGFPGCSKPWRTAYLTPARVDGSLRALTESLVNFTHDESTPERQLS